MYLLEGLAQWNINRRRQAGEGPSVLCTDRDMFHYVANMSSTLLDKPLLQVPEEPDFIETGTLHFPTFP